MQFQFTKCGIVRTAALFLVGTVSAMVASSVTRKKMQAEVDTQIKDVKRVYHVYKLNYDRLVREIRNKQEKLVEEADDSSEDADDILESYGSKLVTTGEARIDAQPETKLKSGRKKNRIALIDRDDYYEGEPDYEKHSATYYEEDDVFTDGYDDPYKEYQSLVGSEFLTNFSHKSGGVQYAYVRNHILRTDFEIELMHGSYMVEILGMDPEPTRRPSKFQKDEE